MSVLRVMVYRHSAFYSPLLAGISGGYFAAEGLEAIYRVMPPGKSVGDFISSGEIHVAQAAVSASWRFLENDRQPPFVHFAQINQRDGFLIAARRPDPGFNWNKLEGARFMFVHGGQPQAMLAYALHKQGIELGNTQAIDAGATDQMLTAFRSGQGDYFHEQAPYPQQLEYEGAAHVVASVGEVIGAVAFSSLAASPAWLASSVAPRFMRAYRKARTWVASAPASEVASALQSFFSNVSGDALLAAVRYYQQLDCWGGDAAIEPSAYAVALDVFAYSNLITRRHPYHSVVVAPPD